MFYTQFIQKLNVIINIYHVNNFYLKKPIYSIIKTFSQTKI